jgi:hypothetical protein
MNYGSPDSDMIQVAPKLIRHKLVPCLLLHVLSSAGLPVHRLSDATQDFYAFMSIVTY